MLGKTPVGTSRSEVEAFVKSQGWSIGAYGTVGEPGPPSSSIQALLGSYTGVPWRVFVRATWLFDAEGKLTDIVIDKRPDVL